MPTPALGCDGRRRGAGRWAPPRSQTGLRITCNGVWEPSCSPCSASARPSVRASSSCSRSRCRRPARWWSSRSSSPASRRVWPRSATPRWPRRYRFPDRRTVLLRHPGRARGNGRRGVPAARVRRLRRRGGGRVESYLNKLLDNVFGVHLSQAILAGPWDSEPGVINLPSVILVAMCAVLLIRGVSRSAKVNAVMVVIKLAVLVISPPSRSPHSKRTRFADLAPFGVSGISFGGWHNLLHLHRH